MNRKPFPLSAFLSACASGGIDRTRADDAILGQFDDANPDPPAGYRNLIGVEANRFAGINLKATWQDADTTIPGSFRDQRLVRLIADQTPLQTAPNTQGR